AATWDLFRGDTSNWADRFFFRDMIREYGEPALDVGCGTGRLLLDFMADGIDIDGVDNSPEMLAQCMEKARRLGLTPMVYQQAMEALNLPRRYQTIIVPSSTFQLLTDLASARYAMERFYAHLKPDGVLVMPFMLIWKEGEPLHGEWKQTGEKVRPEDGALARRWSRSITGAPRRHAGTRTRRRPGCMGKQALPTFACLASSHTTQRRRLTRCSVCLERRVEGDREA
ncbi:MAG: class I SAM-dependent methyltransferase, partial [Chloroflexota bacterium]